VRQLFFPLILYVIKLDLLVNFNIINNKNKIKISIPVISVNITWHRSHFGFVAVHEQN